jgi:transcription antitermination protein NusB
MAARSKARKRALDVLYEADIREQPRLDVLEDHEGFTEGDLNPYVRVLVEGVEAQSARIDELLATYAQGWSVERMPPVDRNILRLGAWELLWGETPDAVAISEAVNLATELSTDESVPFINGLLSRIIEIKPRLVL